MKVVQLKQCCCGCTLRTGTIIIAILGLLGSAYGIYHISNKLVGTQHIKEAEPIKISKEAMITALVIKVAELISNVYLLLAVTQKKANLVMLWVCVNIVILILNCIAVITLGGKLVTTWSAVVAILFSTIIVNIILMVYFLLVVFSFYRELKNEPTDNHVQEFNNPIKYSA